MIPGEMMMKLTRLSLGMIAMAALVQGAAAATYANKSIAFNWVDTSTHAHVGYNTTPYKMNSTIAPGTACGTAPPILDDTISDNIPIGFNFNYGGVVFTAARIMSNGRLQFNNNTACGYGSPVQQLPYVYYNSATDNLDYTMRIYGNDLDPTPQADAPYTTACASTATCYMSYASIGTAPNRQFVVTWNNIPEWAAGGSTSGDYNLQLILNEDGTFIYQYGSDTPGPQATTAQVGWQISQNDYDIPSVGLPANNSAILFYIPSPVAQYHFEQAAWTASGQVVDTSGSTPAYNGTALGTATPGPGFVCNGAVIPYNNKVNTIDAIDTGIPVPTALGGVGTIDFWYQANAAWVGGGAAQLLDATTTNNRWFFAVKLNNGHVRFVITDSNGNNHVAETGVNNIPAGSWTHIALTWNFNALAGANKDHMSIYINGVQTRLLTFTSNGTVSPQVGTLYLGDNRSNFTGQGGTVDSANGTLDEVNIYDFEGGSGLIQRDMNYTASCGSLDHIVIQSSGSGLTCAASTLTVVACQDAACTIPYTGGVTGTLAASGTPAVNWDGTTGGSTGSGFVIPAGTSLVTKNVQVATAGTVTFGVSSAVPAPFNATVCNFGSPACTFTANTAGFIYSDTSSPGNVYAIPPQYSGIPTATLYLRAVQASTTNAAVCTPAIVSSTAAVNIGYTCNNPATCQPGNLATINSTAVAPAGTPVSLGFDANGSAPITVRYDDVGQITLNASATVTPFGGATPVALSGSSNAYTVAPHHFGFSAISAAPIRAGSNFTATITAYNGLATPTATANYGLESPAQGVTLTQTLVQPTGTGASAGALGPASFTPYSGGTTTATTSWSEVGLITLTASNNNYLGSGLPASGTSANIGAFIPDHYTTVVTQACSAGGFSYSGQPFAVQINAMNGAAAITQNYDGTANTSPNFANTVTLADASGSTAGTLAPATVPASAFSAGTANATPAYTFTSRSTPPTPITLRATYTNSTPAYTVTSSGFSEGGTAIFSGRARLKNAHGSENLALPVPFSTEYWLNGWVTNNADSCTGDVTLGASNALSVSLSASPVTCVQDSGSPGLSGAGCAAAGPAAQRFIKGGTAGFAGNFNLWLKAPGGSNSGAVTVTGNVPAWLQYPWLGGAAINPAALATFGIYKGPNQFIYQRENY